MGGLGACSTFVKPTLPGETDYAVRSLEITGDDLTLDWSLLKTTLSVRPDAFLIPGQPYNPYRKAEDARRIVTFWQHHGYFDATVADADLRFDDDAREVDVTWRVAEGARYTVRDVAVRGAPDAAWTARLTRQVTFRAGDTIDLHAYRWIRHGMADALRRAGFLRAEVYSRTFVDRAAKRVDWVYFIDAGPPSVVGEVRVSGNQSVSTERILARVGLKTGQPVDFDQVAQRERDLLDTGAFANARLHADYGTEFVTRAVPPDSWIPPDTGGLIAPGRVTANGDLLPRDGLDAAVDFDVTVVESPSVQTRVGAGVNIDLERVDVFSGLDLQLRNAFGSMSHLVFGGSVGYGLRWRGDLDEPTGLYGSALARWIHPGAIGRLGDLRVTLRFDERLFPGFHWRTAVAGIGLRTTLSEGVSFDLEPGFRADWPVGVGTIDPLTLADLRLAEPARTLNAEITAALTVDRRDDGVEPMRGYLVALRAAYAPGGPVGETPWLRLEADLRYLISLSPDLTIGLRAFGGWAVSLDDDAGVPIGARLFGGGAYGVRGFGTRRLAVYADRCHGPADDPRCQAIPVGGASLFEGSAELRWLPFRQQQGLVAFVDLGGAGVDANPFADGVSVAVGAGLRLRLWHFPLGFDFAYRVTDVDAYGDLDRFFVFLRIGEAF